MKEPSIDDQVTAIDGSAELLEKLRAKGYNKVYISFSGSGDEGYINDVYDVTEAEENEDGN